MHEDKITFLISRELLSEKTYIDVSNEDGAKLCFRGYVRDNNPYSNIKDVIAINYTCYEELAQKEGQRILQAAVDNFSVSAIYCIHRIGKVLLGEASIHVEIVSKHRKQSFSAIEYIMDTIKKSLPIWKQEITIDGKKTWT